MKIATWNVERLKHKKQLEQIQGLCDGIHADILVLTETDKRLHPNYAFCCESAPLLGDKTVHYAVTENRVSIYTNYPVVQLHQTYDSRTAVCAELKTEAGNLLVYGTIIGTLGNRHPSFMEELRWQRDDIRRLSELGDGICVCGDFNCSFSDNYCFTQAGRTTLLDLFRDTGLTLLTERQPSALTISPCQEIWFPPNGQFWKNGMRTSVYPTTRNCGHLLRRGKNHENTV